MMAPANSGIQPLIFVAPIAAHIIPAIKPPVMNMCESNDVKSRPTMGISFMGVQGPINQDWDNQDY